MNARTLLKQNNITARVMTNWAQNQAKFRPGNEARVPGRPPMTGRVIAVSTVDGKRIRSESRGYTRYFVLLPNNVVRGYYSNELRIVD